MMRGFGRSFLDEAAVWALDDAREVEKQDPRITVIEQVRCLKIPNDSVDADVRR